MVRSRTDHRRQDDDQFQEEHDRHPRRPYPGHRDPRHRRRRRGPPAPSRPALGASAPVSSERSPSGGLLAASASSAYAEPAYEDDVPVRRCELVERLNRFGEVVGHRRVCSVY
jgi:hypothetical protein